MSGFALWRRLHSSVSFAPLRHYEEEEEKIAYYGPRSPAPVSCRHATRREKSLSMSLLCMNDARERKRKRDARRDGSVAKPKGHRSVVTDGVCFSSS